jgi:hypothetical protein
MLTTAYYFLQVILCSGVMIGYYWLVLRNKRFHQYNRFYLLVITLLSWTVPLIKIQLNHSPVAEDAQVMQFLYVVADNNSQIDQNISKGGFEWNSGLLFIGLYALVSAVLLFFMIRVFVRLYGLLKTHSCKNVGDVYLILTRASGTPFSFFRYIFWNEEIDLRTETGKQILQHELTHVQQKHSIDKIFMQVVLVAGWFNPFFWLIRKEMEMIHEFIADKKAIENGDTASLAQMLLTAAYPQQRFAMTNPFFFSPIRRRLKMLTNNRDPRFTYIRRLVVLPLLAMVTILFAFRSKNQDEALSLTSVMENVISTVKDGLAPDTPEEPATTTSMLLTASEVQIPDTIIYRKKKDTADEKKMSSAVQLLKQQYKDLVITVDGVPRDFEYLDLLDPASIESISVMKPGIVLPGNTTSTVKSIAIITKKGKAVQNSISTVPLTLSEVQVESFKPQDEVVVTGYSRRVLDSSYMVQGKLLSEQPVVYIDGVKAEWTAINPAEVAYMRVYKGQQAIEKYGDEGRFGAIEAITVRKFSQSQPNISSSTLLPITTLGKLTALTISGTVSGGTFSGTNSKGGIMASTVSPLGTIVANNITASGSLHLVSGSNTAGNVVLPSFPGGNQAWIKHLDDHLDKDVVKRYGAPAGRYTVYVYFMVDPQGKISNIRAENDPGFGTVKAALRVIQQVPNWKPAELNGKTIHMGYRQAISFVVPPDPSANHTFNARPVITVVGKKL